MQIILSRSEIVKDTIGERIEIPGRQYMPYVAGAGLVFTLLTGAPLVGLGLLLVAVHSTLPVDAKEVQIPSGHRRMYSLLASDSGGDFTLEEMIGDAIAVDAKIAREIAQYVYEHASRDSDGDWVVRWKGSEYLACEFYNGMFQHRVKELRASKKSEPPKEVKTEIEKVDAPKLPTAIGNQTRLGAIDVPVVAAIAPSVTVPHPVAIPTDAKTTVQLKAEFPAWFKEWCADLVQKTDEFTRLPFNALQKIWLHSNAGCTAVQFSEVLQSNLPNGATVQDGFVYLVKRSPVAPVSAPTKTEFIGKQVEPTKPKPPLDVRILAAIGSKEVNVDAFVNQFTKAEGVPRAEVIANLKALASKSQIATDSVKKTMVTI